MKSLAFEIDRACMGDDPGGLDGVFRRDRIASVIDALARGARVALIGHDDPFREQLALMARQTGTPTDLLLDEQQSNRLLSSELKTKTIGMLMIQSDPAEFFFI